MFFVYQKYEVFGERPHVDLRSQDVEEISTFLNGLTSARLYWVITKNYGTLLLKNDRVLL